MSNLHRQDRIPVELEDGEEVELFNVVTVRRVKRVRGHNPTVEAYEPEILAGDGGIGKPDAVTHWVAEELYDETGVDVEDHDIDVINPHHAGVDVL